MYTNIYSTFNIYTYTILYYLDGKHTVSRILDEACAGAGSQWYAEKCCSILHSSILWLINYLFGILHKIDHWKKLKINTDKNNNFSKMLCCNELKLNLRKIFPN